MQAATNATAQLAAFIVSSLAASGSMGAFAI